MASPPQDAETKTLDVTFTADGRFNAVVFWFELDLGSGIRLSTGPKAVSAGAVVLPATASSSGSFQVLQACFAAATAASRALLPVGASCGHSGLRTLQPAVQYLAGELAVEAGMVLPLRAAHNTVAMRFDIEVPEETLTIQLFSDRGSPSGAGIGCS
jgi:type III protein arginine methyltransferase